MQLQKYLQPRCINRPKYDTPTPVTLSATGYMKPCNFYASASHMPDLMEWAEENGLDWQKDLDASQGIAKVYESPTWKKLQEVLLAKSENIPKTCRQMCTLEHQQNDEVGPQK